MSMDKHIDFSLPQKDTPLLRDGAPTPRPETPIEPPTPKKTRLRMNVEKVSRHIMTDPLFRNSFFNMASTFILGALGFVFWIIIARLYRTEDVGIATTLISLMTLLSSFTILGLNVSLNRYLPKSDHKNELINSSFVIVTLVAFFACVVFFLGLQSFSPQLIFLRSNIFYIILFTLFVTCCSWNILIDSIFMAFRAAKNILIKNTIISVLKLIFPFALTAFSAYGIFAANSAAFAIGVFIAFAILLLTFKIRPSISVNVSLVKETSAYSFANYIADFMFNMPFLVLPVIILNELSAKYAAYYYVAAMLQNVLRIIPLATAQALLTEGSYDETELKNHVKKAVITISAILLPAIAIIILGGDLLLRVFGKNYADESFHFLQIYSVSTIFAAFLLIANAIMNIKHQIKSLVISNTIAAFLTLYLSCSFISGGLLGIGWGWILGQAIASLVSLFLITRRRNSNSPLSS